MPSNYTSTNIKPLLSVNAHSIDVVLDRFSRYNERTSDNPHRNI